jgi:uncharacterized damage-inducible protein DinB
MTQELDFPEIRPMPGEKLDFVTSLQREYLRIKMNIMDQAERMPEADYHFRPTDQVRSYGELIGHVTNSQFSMCAVLKGVPNPNQGINNELKETKAEWVKAVAASFAFCDDAFSSLTEKSVLEYVKEREGYITRGGTISHFIAHGNDVYGYVAVYMRLKGLVPPTTERGMGGGLPVGLQKLQKK